MERARNLLIILVLWTTTSLFGQSDAVIYKAYINGNMDQWKQRLDAFERQSAMTDAQRLDLINYQYGYIAWCIDQKRVGEAKAYLKRAEEGLDRLEQKKFQLSMVFAYRSAFVGYEIGMAPYKAPFIGQKSENYAQESVRIDPKNPLGYVQLGNIAYFKPSVFGGSKQEALGYYQRALELMERSGGSNQGNWNYMNLLAILIQGAIATDQYTLARDYCVKTLRLEPEFSWVKNRLYPQVIKKLKNNE